VTLIDAGRIDPEVKYFRITAIGEYEVLGIEKSFLHDQMKFSEKILPIMDQRPISEYPRQFDYEGFTYNGEIDKEAFPLVSIMNCLPGVRTFESCSGHEKWPFKIYFKVGDLEGLFFLARCVDGRYWEYGYKWKIEVDVGDYKEKLPYWPTHFLLHSGDVKGKDAYKQAISLIENMYYHLNHENFITGFNINLNKFRIIQCPKK